MMREFARINLVLVLAGLVLGQSSQPQFESSDVHISAHNVNPYGRGGVIRGGRYELRNATMVDLIRTAYSVDADKVVGGPSWLEWDRFDVIAKTPPAAPAETAKTMLQGLLADRFKLVVHQDTNPLPSYALTAGKGKLKLKEAEGSGDTGCRSALEGLEAQPAGASAVAPAVSYSCHNMTMAAFAAGMHKLVVAQTYLRNNNPVLDQTELKGAWDFNFQYTLFLRGLAPGTQTTSLFDAIDRQLGLKLESINVPTAVIVVDSVNQKPTDNLPGVSETLPVLPAEFEVADVRPTAPDSKGLRLLVEPSGRVNIRGVTLKLLIQQAWHVTDEMIVGAPKWLDADRFDIIAKVPEAYTGPPPAPPADLDSVWPMIRTLLADRFKLTAHTEDQTVSAYTLLAAKPKLKKADPLSRTGCKDGPGPGGKDPRDTDATISRVVSCQNVTMGQFAERLQRLAVGYVHNEVSDGTGIGGAWDFTLSFSPAGILRGGGGRGGDGGQPSEGAPSASDPSGGISLFDALTKQLGLKLEMQKRALPVLVIDHVEETPTDN
jgi:uncharacterized protein (TIGR03435 family)